MTITKSRGHSETRAWWQPGRSRNAKARRNPVRGTRSGTSNFVHDGAQDIAEYQAAGFQHQDIGGPSIAGSFAISGPGTYTITGSGADIWNNADQFQFAYQTLAGDGSITAYVASQTVSDPWAKAGVMIRETLSAGSTHAFMAVTPGNGEAFQSRQTTGGSSINANTGSTPAPYWVRVVRAGSIFTGYSSPDGVNWTEIGSDSITMASPAYIGLAVCSHTNSATSTAVFSNVSTTGVIASVAAPVLANRYVYGSYVDEPLAIVSGSGGPSNTNYLHANRVYSVAALTNNSGTVVERYRYDAYGQQTVLAADSVTVQPTTAYGNQIGFTGRYLDAETGLWYFRDRIYAGSIGRFIGRDPISYVNGMSLYAAYFVPNVIDPTGDDITLDLDPDKNHPYTYSTLAPNVGGVTTPNFDGTACTCNECQWKSNSQGQQVCVLWKIECKIKTQYVIQMNQQFGDAKQFGLSIKIGNMTFDGSYGHEQQHIRSMNSEATNIAQFYKSETGICKYPGSDCNGEAASLQTKIINALLAAWGRETHNPNKGRNQGTPGPNDMVPPNGVPPKDPSPPMPPTNWSLRLLLRPELASRGNSHTMDSCHGERS